jgi:hypothetical protein
MRNLKGPPYKGYLFQGLAWKKSYSMIMTGTEYWRCLYFYTKYKYKYKFCMSIRTRLGKIFKSEGKVGWLTELRRHGFPYQYFFHFRIPFAVPVAKILRNYTEFRVAEFRIVKWNSANFCLCT